MDKTENKENKENEVKKETVSRETNTRKTNEELKKTIETQANEIADLKEQVASLIALMGKAVSVQQPKKEEEKTAVVGCRAFSGAPLVNQDESLNYSFACGEEKEIDISDLKDLLKDSGVRKNKILFRDGIFYFKDPQYYDYFGIKNVVDLSDNAIKKIVLTDDVNSMIRKVKEITNDRTNFRVTHTLQFKVAQMIIDDSQPLMGWRYDARKALEDYLGIKFDDLVAYTGLYSILRK